MNDDRENCTECEGNGGCWAHEPDPSYFPAPALATYDYETAHRFTRATLPDGTRDVVTVRRDGSVDLTGNPNEAARVFWQSVGTLGAVGARCP